MNVDPRCRVILIATSLVSGATLGCHRERPAPEQTLAAPVQSYEMLKPKVAQLQSMLADLHKGTDELAGEVPGGTELRRRCWPLRRSWGWPTPG